MRSVWLLLTVWMGVGALAQTPPPKVSDPLRVGIQLYRLGLYDKALPRFEEALKANPNSPEALYWLARSQLKLGLLNPALENARTLVGRHSTYIGGYVVLSEVYVALARGTEDRPRAQGYLEMALSVLKDGEKVNPKYAPLHAQKGAVYALMGQHEKAVESLRTSLLLEDDPQVHALLAEVYLAQGRADEALGEYKKALAKTPQDVSLLLRYASLLLLKNQAAEAAKALEEAVQLRPGNAEAWYVLGQAYFALKRWKEAGVAFEQAIALAPARYPAAYAYAGRVYLELSDPQKAKSRLTVAVRLEGKNPEFRYHLGLANEQLGDKAGARYQCQEALKLKPDYREAQECVSRNQ
ncbi:MAG: tetratricopeptide repeat protein [Thermaceae bacterium]